MHKVILNNKHYNYCITQAYRALVMRVQKISKINWITLFHFKIVVLKVVLTINRQLIKYMIKMVILIFISWLKYPWEGMEASSILRMLYSMMHLRSWCRGKWRSISTKALEKPESGIYSIGALKLWVRSIWAWLGGLKVKMEQPHILENRKSMDQKLVAPNRKRGAEYKYGPRMTWLFDMMDSGSKIKGMDLVELLFNYTQTKRYLTYFRGIISMAKDSIVILPRTNNIPTAPCTSVTGKTTCVTVKALTCGKTNRPATAANGP